ncbi:type VI secretion system-associated FHA domain protein TagH [Tropicimonas sp. S265A]|uniref:type VI secretion system-associated FHA domain protein TagH n=1 Tax=Tropicimonas sp. S265A TaxID=3415134 RepID=UPI003C7E87C2
MQLTLRFQSTGTVPGNSGPVTMQGQSLTIGRAPENDLALPDPERSISKRHCVLEERGDGFIVIDISANGTFLNYDKEPLGPEPQIIADGDILSIGAYELVVEVASETSGAAEPFASAAGGSPFAAPDPGPASTTGDQGLLDDLLGPSVGPVSGGAPGALIPEDADDDLLSGLPGLPEPRRSPDVAARPSEAGFEGQSFKPTPVESPVIPDDWDLDADPGSNPFEKPDPTPVSDPVPDTPAPQPAAVAAQPYPQTFFEALGVSTDALDPKDADKGMARLGATMRALIVGIREILMTRSAIKGEFRMGQTVIRQTGNNPLKFSISDDEAVERIAKPPGKGYMPPEQAVAEALLDIKAHEIAMVAGMQAALKGLLAEFDPETLGEKLARNPRSGGLLKSKKSQYWEVFEETYAAISAQAENDFHELFTREFARAYQAQLEKLK